MNIPTIKDQSYPALFQINPTSPKPFYQFYLQKVTSFRQYHSHAVQERYLHYRHPRQRLHRCCCA